MVPFLFHHLRTVLGDGRHCQEVRLRLSQPLKAHSQGSKGLGTDLESREGLGVWVGFWPRLGCCWDMGF